MPSFAPTSTGRSIAPRSAVVAGSNVGGEVRWSTWVTTHAETGSAFVVPSAASKAGVLALTRSLAVEWGGLGIRMNAIAPGPIPTPGAWDRLMPDAGLEEQIRQRIPLGRFGRPEELADLVAFLLSDLSAWITGECVTVDGGDRLASGGTFNDLARLPREELLRRFDELRGSGRGARRKREDGDG